MSIREIARELYRVQKEIDRIENLLEKGEISGEEKERLSLELRRMKEEKGRLRKILEGMKRYPNIRRPR